MAQRVEGGAPVVAWPPGIRWLAAVLVGGVGIFIAQLGLRVTLDAFDGARRATPRDVVFGALFGVILPFAIVAVLRRLFAARMVPDTDKVSLATRRTTLELPRAELAQGRPWLLPLPAPGEWWDLVDGRRFPRGVEGEALPGLPAPETRAARAMRAFGAARFRLHRRGARALAFKYGVFPLLPAGVLFRAYQHITFGSWKGEYQYFGLEAYLLSASAHWASIFGYLVVFAGTVRVAAELSCYSAAWVWPKGAGAVRWVVEVFCRLVYYVGIPALIALRFLA